MQYLLTLTLGLLSIQVSASSRPNDLAFTAADIGKYNCEQECQKNLRQGMEKDREVFKGAPFDYDFYATADNFTTSSPGDVLKLQPYYLSHLDIPASVSAYKMQYVSLGLQGEKVPVTGFIAIPFTSDAHGGKARLVALAHGTIGAVQSCAPSSSYNLYDYDTWIPLLVAGYAVVATDYAGMGNNYTTTKYINPVSNGEDTYWSVVAARRAFPDTFTRRWATLGHSQGGGTVWAVAENPRVRGPESGEYIGGVASAPGPRVYDMLAEHAKAGELNAQHPAGKYVPLFAKAIQSVNPSSQKVDFLSDAGQKREGLLEELQLCLQGSAAVNADLPQAGLKSASAVVESKQLKALQDDYGAALGKKKQFRDLLVVQGTGDQTEGCNVTIKAYKTACNAGNIVHLSLYPGLDHRPVLIASAPEWMAWFDKKFRGAPDWERCEIRTLEPLVIGKP